MASDVIVTVHSQSEHKQPHGIKNIIKVEQTALSFFLSKIIAKLERALMITLPKKDKAQFPNIQWEQHPKIK